MTAWPAARRADHCRTRRASSPGSKPNVDATSTTTTTTTFHNRAEGRREEARPAPRHDNDPTLTMALATLARQRRRSELSLGLLVVIIAVGGYILVALAKRADAAARTQRAPRVGVRPLPRRASRDPTVRTVRRRHAAAARRAAQRHRLRDDRPPRRRRATRTSRAIQSLWVAIGIAVFVLTLVVVRDVRIFERYRYTVLMLGLIALLLPLAPGIGDTINGARLWVAIGSLTFEPGEIAKVLLVAFFAAYLVDKRELLSQGRRARRPSLRPVAARPRSAAARVGRRAARARVRTGHRHVAAVLRCVRRRCSTWRPNAAAYVHRRRCSSS